MAACKCRHCQAKLTTPVAYMEYIGKNKFYFCNEEHFKEFLQKTESENKQKAKKKELHDRVCELFSEILGVMKITNTALYKEKAELNEVYSDEVIISYLEENKSWMSAAVSRLSGGEYGKIRYVSVILRNKLGDYKPKAPEPERPKVKVEMVVYDSTPVKQNKRRSLEDLEDDF